MMSHKKIHRFFIEGLTDTAIIGENITFSDQKTIHQIHTVLKLKPGESIAVFSNGGNTVTGSIETIDTHACTITVIAITPPPTIARRLIAAVSIIKADHFEYVVQKLTEIGVHTIVPLISHRTIKQQVRLDRLQAISDEALEQSGGTTRVTITAPLSLEQCLQQFPFQTIVLDPLAETVIPSPLEETVVCLIGPEGGWNEQDELLITAAECAHLRITDRVLRTETAAIIGTYTLLW